MMQFVFANLFLVSLGAMLYLAARALPKLADEPDERKTGIFERWVMSEIPQKFDRAAGIWAGKIFRKLKVALLRIDNYLTEKLKKINTEGSGITGQGRTKIEFREVLEVKNQEYSGPDRRAVERRSSGGLKRK